MCIIDELANRRSCLAVLVLSSAGLCGGVAIGANVDCPAAEARASLRDCDGDLIPDACELQIDSVVSYQLDDGTAEFTVGPMDSNVLIWLNQFRVSAHAEEVVAVDIAWGMADDGKPATIVVWSDPNDDGNPEDAVALQAVATLAVNPEPGFMVTVPIPPTFVGNAGRSFFIGCVMHSDGIGAGDYPAALDTTKPSQLRSWEMIAPAIPDLTSPLGGTVGLIDFVGFGTSGNWLLRARTRVVPDCNGDGILDDCEIISGEAADLDDNGILDACEDCDGDHLPDGLEIATGKEQDCDGNGTPDSCDIARAQVEDCNGNGIPDGCEVAFPFSTGSGYLSPIGADSPQSLTIAQPPLPAGDVTISVKASGDFGFMSEYLTVTINGVGVATLFQADGDDCALPPAQVFVTVPQAVWLAAVGDGDAIVMTTASPAVDPDLCQGISGLGMSVIFITVSYLAQGSADEDLDGQVDDCLPSQPADLDHDGDVDGLDLALLLGQWTGAATYAPCPPTAPADLNGDCRINGLDLAILLAAWG